MMITITGTYQDAHGQPAQGAVTFTPQYVAALTTVPALVTQHEVTVTLDAGGAFTVELLASDDPAWGSVDDLGAPQPVPYIVREVLNGLTQGWMGYFNGPGPVDVSDVVPLDQAPAVYVPVPGPPGVATTGSVARFTAAAASQKPVTVTFLGDSLLEGSTADDPGTDDAASLFCAWVADTFGVTVTKSNRAASGHTAYWCDLTSLANPSVFAEALADQSDLYVISYGHNDIRSDGATPGNGYPLDSSLQQTETMIRRISVEVPSADIILSSQSQYTGTAAGSNSLLEPHGQAVRRLAAHYGCIFVDFWGALAARGVTGTTPSMDDIYVHPVGAPGAQHPTSAGHAVWADLFASTVPLDNPNAAAIPNPPTVLPTPLRPAVAARGRWWSAPAMSARTYGADGYRPMGSIGGTATLPITTNTPGDYIECQFIGSECVLRLDTGAGQGVVKITINAVDTYAALDLSTYSGPQSRIPIVGLPLAPNKAKVTLVSGSMTFRGVEVLQAPVQKIKHDAGSLTYSGGGWSTIGLAADRYWGTSAQSGTLGASITVPFVGTALGAHIYRYTTALVANVTVDGVTYPQLNLAGATANDSCGFEIVSGLPYGKHVAVVALASAGRVLNVSGWVAFDETRTQRPTRTQGVGMVGDPATFHVALPGIPHVLTAPSGAGSTVPPYVTGATASGFTLAGSAGALVDWTAEHGRSEP